MPLINVNKDKKGGSGGDKFSGKREAPGSQPLQKIDCHRIKSSEKGNMDKCLEGSKKNPGINIQSEISKIILKYRKTPAIPSRNGNKEKYSVDVLRVESPKFINGSFEPESVHGISEHRPELISMVAFNPIFDGNPDQGYLSSHGKLMEVQHQVSVIRKQNLLQLFNDMQENHSEEGLPEAQEIFNNLRKAYNSELERIDQAKEFYATSLSDIQTLYSLFDIKNKSDLVRNQEQQDNFFELKEFFKQYMGYSEESFAKFTGTKIFLQLASDFRQVLENYSFNLLDIVDSNRLPDSPTKIDTTITVNDGFSFTIDQLRSPNSLRNAANEEEFFNFLKSLPSNSADRLKILTILISKEYRVSDALGDKNIANALKNNFGANDQGNPFDNIVGIPNNSIFNEPVGARSLSALSYDKVSIGSGPGAQELTVLPFEQKYIDNSEEGKTYVPGRSFYVDSIFDLQQNGTSFNIEPIFRLGNEFKDTTNKAYESIMRLLGFSPEKGNKKVPNLHADSIFARTLESINASISNTGVESHLVQKPIFGGGGKQKVFSPNRTIQTFAIGLMRLANRDIYLKFLLFQYVLMVGLISNIEKNSNVIWADLARELRNINAFGSIDTGSDSSNPEIRKIRDQEEDLLQGPFMLAPYIQKLTSDIQKRTREIIVKKIDQFDGGFNDDPDIVRQAVARIKDGKNVGLLDLKPQSFLGNPIVAQVNSKYIQESLLQIATEINHEKEPNIIREFIDFCNKITSNADYGGGRRHLLPDNTGRTRYNFISPSFQILVMYEIFSAALDNFSFIDLGRTGQNIITETNIELQALVRQESSKLIKDRFVGEQSSVGGITKEIREKLNIDNLDEYINKKQEKDLGSKLSKRLKESKSQGERKSEVVGIEIDNQTKRDILNSLTTIAEKIEKEKFITLNFLFLFKSISNQMSELKSKAFSLYNKRTLENFNENLANILDIRSINSIGHIRTSTFLINQELKDAAYAFAESESFSKSQGLREDGVEIVNIKTPIITRLVPSEAKETLYSYLSSAEFLDKSEAKTTMKIASVGIPAGFVQATIDRASVTETTPSAFRAKQNSVVYLNVYKRDLRRDDLIFKPQRFLFDLSLFADHNNIRDSIIPAPGQKFDRILDKITVTDLENVDSPQLYSLDGGVQNSKAITSQNKYSFLTFDKRRKLFENHIKSYLLSEYIKLSSGIKLSEDTFLRSPLPPYTLSPEFQTFLISYLRDNLEEPVTSNQTIQQVLDSGKVSSESKQLVREILFGNAIATPNRTREKILGLKKFDRVLNIAFNIDDFEIDIDETSKTSSGAEMLKNIKISNGFRRVQDGSRTATYLKKRTKNDIIFEDYFITIETLND